MTNSDEFEHFVVAQNPVYDRVSRELAEGHKRSHWMWFIFPQIQGLGMSATSRKYAIESVEAAGRYLRHEILGARLRVCTELVLAAENRSALDIFGSIDAMKFRSSMTLFALCSPDEELFEAALRKYFAGERDEKTLRLAGE